MKESGALEFVWCSGSGEKCDLLNLFRRCRASYVDK